MEGITQPVQRTLTDLLARKLNEQFPLRTEVAKVWNTAQQPVLLDKNYSAWLRITPREVLLYPLYAQNNRVKLSAGISTFADRYTLDGKRLAPGKALALGTRSDRSRGSKRRDGRARRWRPRRARRATPPARPFDPTS